MLDKIILFSIKNKLFVGFMTLMLIFWGVWSATRLPIDAIPDITNNQVQIITSTPTLASQEVEQLVTFPIEQAIANIPGLEETRSIEFMHSRYVMVWPIVDRKANLYHYAEEWTSNILDGIMHLDYENIKMTCYLSKYDDQVSAEYNQISNKENYAQ